MDTEDFTFPRVSDTCTYSIDSPPLWNPSPAGSPNPYQVLRGGNKGGENDCFEAKLISQSQRKSFPHVQNGKKRIGVDDEEDPMDLLWEGFNEELSSTRGSASTLSSREVVEFRCAPALTVAKINRALIPNKSKPGMVVIAKVLKKLFSLNNSQGKPRKRVL